MVNKHICDFSDEWKDHLAVYTIELLTYPRQNTVDSYLQSAGLNEGARRWINKNTTIDLLASSIRDGISRQHWFARLRRWQQFFLIEFIIESNRGGTTSLAQFAKRRKVPVRNAYYWGSVDHINWLRGQLAQLKVDWFRLVEFLHKDKKSPMSKNAKYRMREKVL